MSGEKLHKLLSQAGIASRRKSEELIRQGRITVDGRVVTDVSTRVEADKVEIRFDGARVRDEPKVAYLVNKPKGYLCTSRDPAGRPSVVELIQDSRRLFPVGRLDEDSEGLILVTNDGDLANRVAHPRYGIPKTYLVRCRGGMTRPALEALRKGVWLAEGRVRADRIRLRRRTRETTILEVVLHEGRNREIRRMFSRIGFPVRALKRTRIGHLSIHRLRPGASRRLTRSEIDRLKSFEPDRMARRMRSRTRSEGDHGRGGPRA